MRKRYGSGQKAFAEHGGKYGIQDIRKRFKGIRERRFTALQKIRIMFIPMGAIVTASGTGAELNNGVVITNEAVDVKAGVLGAHTDFAVLDVAYTMSLPEKQVISRAFDTLSHSMETYPGSPREITLSDEIAEAVMRNVIRNIRLHDGEAAMQYIYNGLIWIWK